MSVYHKRKPIDWLKTQGITWAVRIVVYFLAGVIVALSFEQTKKIAHIFALPPLLFVGIVEAPFATLMLIRSIQRATQRDIPRWLEWSYRGSFVTVTGINTWGMCLAAGWWGLLGGPLISGTMWVMDNVAAWLVTGAHKPYKKTAKERRREVQEEVETILLEKELAWRLWVAQQPPPELVKMARKEEEYRKKVIGDGLPEYFLQEPEPIPQIEAEPIIRETETEEAVEEAAVVPMPMRQIGFHMEQPKGPAPRFQPNMKARAEAMEKARALMEELGRIPTKGELMEQGISEHYAKWAKGELKKQ